MQASRCHLKVCFFFFFLNSLHEADHPSLHVLCTCSYCKPIISNLNIIIDQDDEGIAD